MKFIASIFIILAFTPQSKAGELWDFARATLCPIYTDYMLCIKANKEDYYSGKCEKISVFSPAEDEKLALLVEDQNNKEDIKKLSDLNPYLKEAACPTPSYWISLDVPEEEAGLKKKEKEWLDCLAEEVYPKLLEVLQCKELLKNSEKEL